MKKEYIDEIIVKMALVHDIKGKPTMLECIIYDIDNNQIANAYLNNTVFKLDENKISFIQACNMINTLKEHVKRKSNPFGKVSVSEDDIVFEKPKPEKFQKMLDELGHSFLITIKYNNDEYIYIVKMDIIPEIEITRITKISKIDATLYRGTVSMIKGDV